MLPCNLVALAIVSNERHPERTHGDASREFDRSQIEVRGQPVWEIIASRYPGVRRAPYRRQITHCIPHLHSRPAFSDTLSAAHPAICPSQPSSLTNSAPEKTPTSSLQNLYVTFVTLGKVAIRIFGKVFGSQPEKYDASGSESMPTKVSGP